MSERILTGVYPFNDYRSYLRHSDETEQKYGLPDKKKYPMPDRDHVLSAIKFFNYVSPADEKELAKNILARIREYGITDINVGENNRFGKYYNADHLEHHGILGMRWGVRRYQNSDGSLTTAGKKHYSVKKVDMEADWKAKTKEFGEDGVWNWLQNRIEKESGDWYNGKPVSDGFKRAMEDYDKKYAELKKKHNTYQYVEEMYNYRGAKFMKLTEKYWEQDDGHDEGFILKKEYRKGSKGAAEANKAIDKAFDQIEKDPKYKALKAKHKEAVNNFEKERRQLDNDYENRLASVALNDLGYKDTEAARKRAKAVIFWD